MKKVHLVGNGWRRLWLVIWLVAGSTLSLSVCAQPRDETSEKLERLLEQHGMVGAAWMLHGPSHADMVGGAGLRHSGLSVPVTAEDRFQVGSIAKPVLTIGVLRLVSQKLVSLDAPISEILPEVSWDNPWDQAHPVRLRHLLDHTAGLEDATFRHIFSRKARPDTPLADALGAAPLRFTVRVQPGSEFSYSNIGYTLVAMVIERLTGERYEDHLQANVLQPLGMTSSTFSHVSQARQEGESAMVMGHLDRGVPQQTLATFLRPAGQFITTAADMGRFAAFLMSDGTLDGAAFVDAQLLREMGAPRTTQAAVAGLDKGYSLGMWTRDRHGVVGVCHSGETIGFRALLCLYPGQRKAFFIALNMDSESADYDVFYGFMVDRLDLPTPPRAATVRLHEEDVKAWVGLYRRLPAKVPAFEYLDVVFNQLWLKQGQGVLVLKPFFADEVLLEPVGGRRFIAGDHVAASHVLLGDQSSGYELSTGLRNYKKTSRMAMVALWANLLLGLAGLLYVLGVGLWRAVRQRHGFFADPVAPALAVLVSIPIAGYLIGRSWQSLGDLTFQSGMLATATAALPIAAVWGLWRIGKQHNGNIFRRIDAWALGAVLQWCLVLAVWGMLPLRTWV